MKKLGTEGFTLIEVLIASAVSSILLIILYSSYNTLFSTVRTLSAYSEFYENINHTGFIISHIFENTLLERYQVKMPIVCTDDGDNSVYSSYTLKSEDSFSTESLVYNHPFASLVETGIYCREDPSGNGLYDLMVRTDDTPDSDVENGGFSTILLRNVVSFTLEFQSGNTWVKKWDSREAGHIPALVKSTLIVKNYSGKKETFIFKTTLQKL